MSRQGKFYSYRPAADDTLERLREAQGQIDGAASEERDDETAGKIDKWHSVRSGNNVDFSQRYADSEDDACLEQAERILRSMEREPSLKPSVQFADPEKRREFVEGLAAQLSGKKPMPKQAQSEEDEPILTRAADDKFWNNPEELQKFTRKKL